MHKGKGAVAIPFLPPRPIPMHNQLLKIALWMTIVLFTVFSVPASFAHRDLPNNDKVYSGSETTGPTREVVQISNRAIEAIGLEVTTVKLRPLPLEISVLGEIEAMPTRSFMQHALLAGRVDSVKVELGDNVTSGQILAILDSAEVNRLAAELLNTKSSLEAEIKKVRSQYSAEREQTLTRLELAQAEYDRISTLAKEKIASLKAKQAAEAELLMAKSTQKNLSTKMKVELEALETKLKISVSSLRDRLIQTGVSKASVEKMLESESAILQVPIRSTRAGVVTEIMANPGETVNGKDPLFEILDLDTVFATADVYEADMNRVKVGQTVSIKTAVLPGRVYRGTLSYVGSEVDQKKRTLPVKVQILNADRQLKPEMFVNMYIQTAEPTMAMLLPKEAVVEKNGHYGVFIEIKPGVFQRSRVDIGRSVGDDVEILSGIKPGVKVVTRGAFQLDAHFLKESGVTDAFSHPTESGHDHDHEEGGGHEHSSAKSSFNPILIVVVVFAFILGGAVAIIVPRLGVKNSEDDLSQ